MKILIIDGDNNMAESERDYLHMNGFECDIANDGETGLRMALRTDYSLILLETELEKQDGFSVCKDLRAEKDIPVMFLSSKGEDIYIVRAFNLGADDYITKPFSPSELVVRVKGHISRYEALTQKNTANKSGIICIRDLIIDKEARRVYVDSREVSMPVREFDLLVFLAENPNIVFSKERLFDRLWGMDAMGDVSTVTVHIQRIRDKIEKGTDSQKYIETVWGVGYRFRG